MENLQGSSQLTVDSSQDNQNGSSETNNSSSGYAETSAIATASPDKPVNPGPAEIITVPITDLTVPSWNPRKFMDEAKMQDLMAYLEKGGLMPRPWVWKGSGQAPYSVISGQRRLEAHRRLGRTQIEIEMLDVTLEEAKVFAFTSNQNEEMHWWETCLAIGEAIKGHSGNQRDLAAILGVSQTKVSWSKRILEALTPAAQSQLEYQVLKNDPTYDLPEKAIVALTDLNDPQNVEEALKVVIDKKMTETQAKNLVKWVKAGNKPEEYKEPVKSKKVGKFEGEGSSLGDGSVDDGVAGFEKLAVAGIAENLEGSSQITADSSQENSNQQPGEADLSGTDSTPDGRSPQAGVASSLTPAYSAGIPRNDGLPTEALAKVGESDSMDPYSSYWQKLPPNVTVTRTMKGYEIHAIVAPNEAVPAAYGLLANLEHLKGLANEPQDLQFRDALPQVMEEGRKARMGEKAAREDGGKVTAQGTGETQKATLIETMKTMVKDKMKTAPADVTDALLKDGKQALNYQIRKGMRGILKDWL